MSLQPLHATAVAIDGKGVLLLGASGAGKSDLALRLIDRGARLVSDDAVPIDCSSGSPVLTAAPNIEGNLEVRGVGICLVACVPSAPLRLAVALGAELERLPAPGQTIDICGYQVPCLRLFAFATSAPIKLEYALRCVVDAGLWPVARNASVASEGENI